MKLCKKTLRAVGVVARHAVKATDVGERRRVCSIRRGFTLIELLVVVAVIAVLVAILLPALGRSLKTMKDMKCQLHLHQLWVATIMYADENSGKLPPVPWSKPAWEEPGYNQSFWTGRLAPYLSQSLEAGMTPGQKEYIFTCPYDEYSGAWGSLTSSYVVYPELADWNWTLSRYRPEVTTYMRDLYTLIHLDPIGMNYSYLDGHVEFLPRHDQWHREESQ